VIPYVDTLAYSAVAAECARLLSAAGTQMILAITENTPPASTSSSATWSGPGSRGW